MVIEFKDASIEIHLNIQLWMNIKAKVNLPSIFNSNLL